MFDIEKALKTLPVQAPTPSESLRQDTRRKVREALRQKPAGKCAGKKLAGIASFAAAVAIAAVLFLSVPPVQTAEAAGYYTIDINPSICVAVDSADIVLSVRAQNDDAGNLLDGLTLTGLSFEEALRSIVLAAEDGGYLKDDGHVLIAHFGSQEGISEQDVDTIVGETTRSRITVMLLKSTKSDYEAAQAQNKSAGIALLEKNAQAMGVQDGDMDTVMDEVLEKNQGQGQNTDAAQNQSPGNAAAHEKNDDAQNSKDPAADKKQDTGAGNNGNGNPERPENAKPEKSFENNAGSDSPPGQDKKQDKKDETGNAKKTE